MYIYIYIYNFGGLPSLPGWALIASTPGNDASHRPDTTICVSTYYYTYYYIMNASHRPDTTIYVSTYMCPHITTHTTTE